MIHYFANHIILIKKIEKKIINFIIIILNILRPKIKWVKD